MLRKRKSLWAAGMGLAVFLFGAVGIAGAAQTIQGSTGLINIPSADVVKEGELSAAFHSLPGGGVVALTYGVVGPLEVGVATLNRGGAAGRFMPVLKFQLMPERKGQPAVAVGLEDRAYYVVMSERLGSGRMRGHLGFGSDRFHGLFLGVSAFLNPVSIRNTGGSAAGGTLLMAEYDGRGVNVGARIGLTQELTLDVSMLNLQTASVGIGFRTDF